MVDLPRKKVGLIACSGEELASGTLSRVAVRQVLESLRTDDTVTLCLPLFLAGNEQERAFARFYPTIAVDGCDKQCAKRATEKYSANVAGEIVVDDLLERQGVTLDPTWRREPGPEGMRAARVVAENIAESVDTILGHKQSVPGAAVAEGAQADEPAAAATCACGSGIPVSQIQVGQGIVSIVALEPLLDLVHSQVSAGDNNLGLKLLEAVRVYNQVPAGAQQEYEQALLGEYRKRFGSGEA